MWVSWQTEEPGASWIEYGLEELTHRTPTQPATTQHRIPVLGLKADRTYRFRAVTETATGVLESEVIEAETLGPTGLGPIEITDYDPSRVHSASAHFAVATRTSTSTFALIIDREGDIVWFVEGPPQSAIQVPKIARDGRSLIWAEWDRDKQIDIGRVVKMSLDGETLETTRAPFAHHDFVEHADGTVGFLSVDIRDLGNPRLALSDVILETTAGETEDRTETVFSFFDDYGHPFWRPCGHATGLADEWGLEGADEWTHANSLMFDDNDDAYFVHARFLDALLKIDRATGEVIWQLGGEHGDFTLPNGDPAFVDTYAPELWSHGHMSHIWDDGFILFDNGDHRSPQVSRVAEYRFDVDNATVEEVWSYSDGRFMKFLSDAQKLDNGNVFIVSTPYTEMSEILTDGTVVWRAELADDEAYFGRAAYLADLYALESSLLYQ